MKLYRISTIICTVLAATLLIAACGGTGGVTPVVLDSEALITEDAVPRQLDCLGSSMKVQRNYDYDRTGYPCVDNVAIVPVAGNMNPDPAAAGKYQINTLAEGDKLEAHLNVDGDTQVLAHLHYDAEQWVLAGVASKNVWGTKDFVGGVVPLRPGLAMLYSMPVGDSKNAFAKGEFAEACFAPQSKQVSEIYEYPDGYCKQGVLWIHHPDVLTGWNSCATNFRMDGVPGDLSSKDEELLGIGECTGVAFDNYVHDVILDGYGYQYNGDIWNATLTLSWHEFFRGDHDSDGIVTVGDLTPIGQYWAEYNTDHWANREVTDATSFAYVNLMDALADDTPDPEQKTDYRFQNHSLNSFWFVEDGVLPVGIAYGYEVDVDKNAPADATDSNWDGFVRDWYNYDSSDPADDTLDAYYDMPALGLYHPGDSPAVGLNFDHALSGYCVWCVKQGDSVSLNSADPLKIYCREYDGINFEEPGDPNDDWTAKLWDSTLGKSITVARYPALEDPNFGCYRTLGQPVMLYEGEYDYLAKRPLDSFGLPTMRRFAYFAMYVERLALVRNATHFVFPSRMVMWFMYEGLETSITDQQKLNRFKTLQKAYNPRARDYCGIPLLTDLIKGEKYKTSNEYRFGDDYALRTGSRIPAEEVEELLSLPSMYLVLKEKRKVDSVGKLQGKPRDWNSPIEEMIITSGEFKALPADGAEIQIDEKTWWCHDEVDVRARIKDRCNWCGSSLLGVYCVGTMDRKCSYGERNGPAFACAGYGCLCCKCYKDLVSAIQEKDKLQEE